MTPSEPVVSMAQFLLARRCSINVEDAKWYRDHMRKAKRLQERHPGARVTQVQPNVERALMKKHGIVGRKAKKRARQLLRQRTQARIAATRANIASEKGE